MDIRLLIDQIVRQTTVLIAQLSTAAGVRAPLANVADQVFLELTAEIERQGIGKKVVADMFGMSLRTYQRKIQRVAESTTIRNKTLWEAVLEHLENEGSQSRSEIIARFKYDGEENVAAVLNDLAQSGVIYRVGRGHQTVYGATSDSDLHRLLSGQNLEILSDLVYVQLYRMGPIHISELTSTLQLDETQTTKILARLSRENRIELTEDGIASCGVCMIPVGAKSGWEAAVFDHFQAVAKAISHKLLSVGAESKHKDQIGGATLSFDIWDEHPEAEEVLGLLRKVRVDVNAVWERVVQTPIPPPADTSKKMKVTFYFGQNVEQPES